MPIDKLLLHTIVIYLCTYELRYTSAGVSPADVFADILDDWSLITDEEEVDCDVAVSAFRLSLYKTNSLSICYINMNLIVILTWYHLQLKIQYLYQM